MRGGLVGSGTRLVAAVLLLTASARDARAVPSFSRQTGQACSACHTEFPELNSFGRSFKLNGYTLTSAPTVSEKESGGREALSLPMAPLLSAMFQASYTATRKDLPSDAGPTQNGDVLFPQQFSVFLAGAFSSHLGGFIQATYDSIAGSFGWDNTDIRGARQGSLGSKDIVYGFTLNNNPTVQDLWNSTPAWGFPWASSSAAPSPSAATLVDGTLAQSVAGLGGYALWNDLLYVELSAYRSAPQGAGRPLDGSAGAVVHHVAPYFRIAVQHEWGNHALEVGAYGLSARIFPGPPLQGAVDRFTDYAADAQYQFTRSAGGGLSAHATYIHEKQDLDATFAAGGSANPSDTLETFRADGTYRFGSRCAVSLGWFSTRGDADAGLRAPAPLSGSATGKPDSTGGIVAFDWNPWQNTRFSVQYTAYGKFNGASTNYDGFGRDARDNDAVYVLAWLAF